MGTSKKRFYPIYSAHKGTSNKMVFKVPLFCIAFKKIFYKDTHDFNSAKIFFHYNILQKND